MSQYYRKIPTALVEAEVAQHPQHIETLEGRMLARAGDYIVTGTKGEKYPVKKEIFEETYESADTCFVDICVDFDGVCSNYASGWVEAFLIPDPPVAGLFRAVYGWLNDGLTLAIYSARSSQSGGVRAMKQWFEKHDKEYQGTAWIAETEDADLYVKPKFQGSLMDNLQFPYHKPAAQVYLDDRGFRFNGTFPSTAELKKAYKVWYRSD